MGDILAEGAGRALGKLVAKFYQNKGLGFNAFTKLYDTCVAPLMDYCSGVWGYDAHVKLDHVHHRAQRAFLG